MKSRSSAKELLHCNHHLSRQALTDLFTTTISESYKQEMRQQKLKRKDFQKILEESPHYEDGRTSKLHFKSRRRAKCSNTKCDKDLRCVSVSGALSVLYSAVLQKCYFCHVKTCIHARPPWTNIKLYISPETNLCPRLNFIQEDSSWKFK